MLQDRDLFDDNMMFVLKRMEESFYIFQFIDKTKNLLGMDDESEIIDYLDRLVDEGILRKHFAKYEKVIK